MSDCIFCKIVSGDIPSKKIYEDEQVIAFHDINPQAPVHILVVPKKHVSGVNELAAGDEALVGHVYGVIARLVRELGVAESGYRVVVNSGADGQQSVPHLHFHVLGGRLLSWPPG
ncbi:MAG: histidine triad nucleotide-binding protein [Eubacteriales bacterium]|nr:histidine triad nucleotide-binding protein [Eubacteriales bacterium]